ncbi:MAG: lipid A export permease/ATP-binding protein MsbA [Phascolarctobacterium sp.]|nr:lipid A export permease/ATP-binding protein MsbA [Phascolarctobacterium sp.]
MKLYLRALTYVKPYIARALLAMLCAGIAAGGTAYLPWIIKDMVDQVLNNKDTSMLSYIVISIIVVFAIRGVAAFMQYYLMNYVGQRVIIDIRGEVFAKIQRLSMSFFDKNKTGEIMSYVTNDVGAMQQALVDNVVDLVTESVILLASIVMMLYLNWKLFLICMSTFPGIVLFIDVFGRRIRRSGKKIQEATADVTSVLQESVSNPRVIKSFVREDFEINRFNVENERNFSANIKYVKQAATLTPTIEFIAACGVTIILWYGGNAVIDGELTAGALVAFLTYAVNISNPIKRLGRIIGNIQKALAAAQRVFDVMDLPEIVHNEPGAKVLPEVKGAVAFENVDFGYNEDEKVLSNVSFDIAPGQVVALVGPSGAGKTTIASLLPRFYDVTNGTIKIDGQDIRAFTLESLREHVGIVPQETSLFNGTVYDNILFGRLDATKEEVEAAAKAANAHNFILDLPNGYETLLGDRGVNISGGQRQRISIARAILKNPSILILDEATSALDTESERIVQEALDRLMVGRTAFVIAHRLSTIKNADRILVFEKGQIVEDGNHDELLAKDGLYAHLYNIQYSSKNSEESTES